MAYNLVERFTFSKAKSCEPGPGTYDFDISQICKTKPRTKKIVGFLSETPRNTSTINKVYTDKIYSADLPQRISNITAFTSKRPRFPYESFGKEDLERLLCQCGINNTCKCEEPQEDLEAVCKAKAQRTQFIGPTPRVPICERMVKSKFCPPFYNSVVNESTAFYHGCKWSRRTSKRTSRSLEVRPGPADYDFTVEPTESQLCIEKVKFMRRRTSKQLRFIEEVQNRNIREGRPGPASYSLRPPQKTELDYYGPKAERFIISKYDVKPGPADYELQRDFDLPKPLEKVCLAPLQERACFGVKAPRFKFREVQGPCAADYNAAVTLCQNAHCPDRASAFGSSNKRFKDDSYVNSDEEDDCPKEDVEEKCPQYTWQFKNKPQYFEPIKQNPNAPSPADFWPVTKKISRSAELQHMVPFYSSEGRFVPWHDWMPVHAQLKTPGPGYYCLEKPHCYPAVPYGPTSRSPRFPPNRNFNPPPNAYKVYFGIEQVLETHNDRLKRNLKSNKDKVEWTPPLNKCQLSFDERMSHLINKSIALLNDQEEETKTDKKEKPTKTDDKREHKNKLLKTFLRSRQVPVY